MPSLGPSRVRLSDSKKVLLFQVFPVWRSVQSDTRLPVGMLYLGNSLKTAGYQPILHHIQDIKIDETLASIDLSDVLFVAVCSVLTGYSLDSAITFSTKLKALHPNLPVVWGGVQPTAIPEVCLAEPYVDFVGMGDGDELIVDIARMFSGDIPADQVAGLAFRDENGSVQQVPRRPLGKDLDAYRPDFSLLDVNRYIFDGRITGLLMTSRGCPYDCTFCYNNYFSKRRWRKHSVEFVVSMIDEISKTAKFDRISFSDDLFTVDKHRATEIIRLLHQRGIRLFGIDIKVNTIDDEMISVMNDCNVESCFFGLESLTPHLLTKLHKQQTPEQIVNMVTRFRDLAPNVSLQTGILTALPFETKADLIGDLRAGLRLTRHNTNLSMYFGVLMPLPGTEMMVECNKKGFAPKAIADYVALDLTAVWKICHLWAGFDVTPGMRRRLRLSEGLGTQLSSNVLANTVAGEQWVQTMRRLTLRGLYWAAYFRVFWGIFVFQGVDAAIQKNYWDFWGHIDGLIRRIFIGPARFIFRLARRTLGQIG